MHRTNSDQAIWTYRTPVASSTPPPTLILLAHVDDILMLGDSSNLKEYISSRFIFKDLGPASLYNRVYVIRDHVNRRIYLDQATYVNEILDDFCMSNCTPASTHMEPKITWKTLPTDQPLEPKGIKIYQRAIGQLMYLILAIRPDIAFAVTKLAQFCSSPVEKHWNSVLHIMRYLYKNDSVCLSLGISKVTILHNPEIGSPPPLVGYFDASLMDCVTSRKSNSGYIFFYMGSCI